MFTRRVCQALHDEHRATIELLERLGLLLEKHRNAPPDVAAATTARLLRDIPPALEGEVGRHFDFEETQLFPTLAEAGDVAIGANLTDEHRVMQSLGRELAEFARGAQAHGFDAAGWQSFRRIGGELSDRLQVHIQKEEMVLLPLLEETLDADTDATLHDAYAEAD